MLVLRPAAAASDRPPGRLLPGAPGGSICFGHLFHAGKSKIILRHTLRRMRSAEACLSMATVNPGRRKANPVCRQMIMEQAFCCVQDLMPLVSRFSKSLDHVFEVAQIRLVGTDVLGGKDIVEVNPQPCVACFETLSVHI